MSAKQATRRGLRMLLIVALVIIAALLLVPSFAALLGHLVADLWVTVMGAVAGILGGLMGS